MPVRNERPVVSDRRKVGKAVRTPVVYTQAVLHAKKKMQNQFIMAAVILWLDMVEKNMPSPSHLLPFFPGHLH